MKKLLILIAVALLLTGCGAKGTEGTKDADKPAVNNPGTEAPANPDNSQEGFSFENGGVTVPMNVDAAPVVKSLGEPVEYFEAASCAFQGLDKIYYYNGFEVGTYPNGDKDYVSYVNLLDDSVATDKGIYLGSTKEDVIAAYGEDFTAEGSSMVYRLGETKLTFILEDDAVASITYAAIVEGLNN
ncbi:putative small lipoprotein YifL [Anaerotaenia torta]|uniref:hypothetical protein n=1 Tax=Anaerotaenia torta TaxID=433293 RepID=UPI003D19E679